MEEEFVVQIASFIFISFSSNILFTTDCKAKVFIIVPSTTDPSVVFSIIQSITTTLFL